MIWTIRRAQRGDGPVIVAFNQGIARETEGLELDEIILSQGVEAVLCDPHRGFYTVALSPESEVIGQMLITYEWSDWRNGWFWWIQSVYVRPDYRRQGVFRALFEHILASAQKSPQVIGLRLYHDRHNHAGHATYRALGLTDTNYGLMELYPLPGQASAIKEVAPPSDVTFGSKK